MSEIKWPEKTIHSECCDSRHYQEYASPYLRHKGEKLCNCGSNDWNEAIDACRKAYEESKPLEGLDLEELANLCHEQWSGWMEYLFSKSYHIVDEDDEKTGDMRIPKKLVDRWKRQMNTEYKSLPENEKESDKKEARKIISLIKSTPLRPCGTVSVDDIARIACQKFYSVQIEELHKAKWDRLLDLEILDDLAQAIHAEVYGGKK